MYINTLTRTHLRQILAERDLAKVYKVDAVASQHGNF